MILREKEEIDAEKWMEKATWMWNIVFSKKMKKMRRNEDETDMRFVRDLLFFQF